MLAFLDDYTSLEKFFAICAISCGILFALRMIMLFLGHDFHHDADVDMHGDFDVDTGHGDFDHTGDHGDISDHGDHGVHGHHGDASEGDISFRVLSIQGLSSFFMMFGIVGLALLRESGWSPERAVMGAVCAGLATCWGIKWLFSAAMKLKSSGNIDLKNAIGQEGDVYLRIPSEGSGKVRVTVQEHLKIWDAICVDKQEIKTGELIRVVDVTPNDVLIVEKIE
ncbi:MAG: NfeD family protein [Sedimentisphaerales bacterium]|nr:NfeD family protein [Sedimentisphaerales bacterium]